MQSSATKWAALDRDFREAIESSDLARATAARLGGLAARAMTRTRVTRASVARARLASPLRRRLCLARGGSDMPWRDTLRAKLDSERLRCDATTAWVSLWGTGRSCDACDSPISGSQKAVLATFRDGAVLRFHRDCFSAWERERQPAGTGER